MSVKKKVLFVDNFQKSGKSDTTAISHNVVSWITDTGSKGYPLFRFGTGREGGWETPTSERTSSRPPIYVLASNTGTQRVYPGSGPPEAKSATPACLD